jgi:hypothetical protein
MLTKSLSPIMIGAVAATYGAAVIAVMFVEQQHGEPLRPWVAAAIFLFVLVIVGSLTTRVVNMLEPRAKEREASTSDASSPGDAADRAASEHAVLVHLELSDSAFGTPNERAAIYKLSDDLAGAIERAGVGDFDGDEFGGGTCVLYMYGPDADRLWDAVAPTLRASPSTTGGHAIKRYGEPGAKQVEVPF